MSPCNLGQHTKLFRLLYVVFCLLVLVDMHSCTEVKPTRQRSVNTSDSLHTPSSTHGHRPPNSTAVPTQADEPAYNASLAETALNLVLKDLFEKYGDGRSITFEAFEHMLENIGLADLHIHDHSLNKHLVQGSFEDFHEDHNHTHDAEDKQNGQENEDVSKGTDMTKRDLDHRRSSREAESSKKQRSKRNTKEQKERSSQVTETALSGLDLRKCLSTSEILEGFGYEDAPVIDEDAFILLCPALVYQLDNHACLGSHKRRGCSQDSDGHSDCDGEDEDHNHVSSEKAQPGWNSSSTVWGYAFLSVLIISLVGLLSVAVIPLTKKVFYNHLLQFLVALAVGSLTGDACLHLLPHAISPHTHSDSSHGSHDDESILESKDAVWKGLVALSGIYFFFLMERIMGMVTERRRRKNKEKRDKSPQGYKQVQVKETEIGAKLSAHSAKVMSCEEMLMVVHPGKETDYDYMNLRHLAEDVHDEVHENCTLDDLDSNNVRGHSHGHSHGPLPSSVSSVAWMVIMGDGLHNFSDGLAIGASFANSLSGGLSTSVAVFCHELPHELGDFAVLLRAGMPAKQAIIYNLLSSVLCFLGMVVGVCVGNLSSASLWIFALIGGMFIYVALVDMLPEMTAVDPKAGEHPLLHLLLQNLGMLTGTGIMLVIALYEEQIQIPQWEV